MISRGDRFESAGIVSFDGDDRQRRVIREKLAGACIERRTGNVNREENHLVLLREEGLEQQLRFLGASTSELHECRVVRKHFDDLFRLLLQYAAFCPRYVVLGDFADLLE